MTRRDNMGRFMKGVASWAKGKKMPFSLPIGTERVRDGYLWRKINDRSQWRQVHILNWEGLHGPVPDGVALKCLDGDKLNTDPSNWEALPRAVLTGLVAIGTESVRDGYLWRKIHDGLPARSQWRQVHILNWEELHGPIQGGMVLKCLDGDKLNTDPTNWEALPRAVLTGLNGRHGRGYEHAVAELKPTIMAVAKLEHQLRERRNRGGE